MAETAQNFLWLLAAIAFLIFAGIVREIAITLLQLYRGRVDRDSNLFHWLHSRARQHTRRMLRERHRWSSFADFEAEWAELDARWKQSIFYQLIVSRIDRTIGSPWDSGESYEWTVVGADDADNGICRAQIYRNHSYNSGWYNQVSERRMKGWRCDHLAPIFDRMNAKYFNRKPWENREAFYEEGDSA